MKITHIITSMHMGGTERFLTTLVLHQSTKHQIEIIILKEIGLLGEQLQKKGYTVTRISSIFSLILHLKNTQPDIIHTHLFRGNIIGRLAGACAGIKAIISSQQSIDLWKKSWHWKLEAFSSRWAKKIIANSQAARRILAAKAHIPEEKIAVVYIGTDQRSLPVVKNAQQFRITLGLRPDTRIITCLSRLHREKGSNDIPEIIKRVIGQIGTTTFLLTGTGPLKKSIERSLAEQKLEKYVTMLGVRQDIADILNASSVLFLPSIEESFSNAALEAMLLGVPVVITDVGGNSELVTHNVDGLLVAAGKPHLMADAIALLCRDQRRAEAIGSQGRIKAGRFKMSDTLKNIDLIYSDIIKSP